MADSPSDNNGAEKPGPRAVESKGPKTIPLTDADVEEITGSLLSDLKTQGPDAKRPRAGLPLPPTLTRKPPPAFGRKDPSDGSSAAAAAGPPPPGAAGPAPPALSPPGAVAPAAPEGGRHPAEGREPSAPPPVPSGDLAEKKLAAAVDKKRKPFGADRPGIPTLIAEEERRADHSREYQRPERKRRKESGKSLAPTRKLKAVKVDSTPGGRPKPDQPGRASAQGPHEAEPSTEDSVDDASGPSRAEASVPAVMPPSLEEIVSSPQPADDQIPVPKRIDDYTIESVLGVGGMAVIYKSMQRTLGRTVALKVLRPEVAQNEQFARRFEREAQTLASLRHENILQIFDHKIEADRQYMVMEYVEGIDLFDLLDRYGQLPTDVAAIIACQMARGLDHAHYRGVIHRDIKPANVMLTHNGTAKLMDFGIARVPDARDLTQEGTGVGTPSYMSPEQVVGDPMDGRTDIFSLGVVLYQMVTGQKPFLADNDRNVLQKIRGDRPPPARRLRPDLPRDLERIIGRCLQKRPDDRYWPTRELVRALERHMVGQGVQSEASTMVHFFMQNGIITADEGEQQLELARKSGYSASEKKTGKVRQAGRLMWAGAALAALVLLAAGFAVGAFVYRGRPAATGADAHAPKTEPARVEEAPPPPRPGEGLLRVLVRPWAEVHIDGKKAATTPIARALRLKEGKHTVTLRNPHCEPKNVEVTVSAGKTAVVSEALKCKDRKATRGR